MFDWNIYPRVMDYCVTLTLKSGLFKSEEGVWRLAQRRVVLGLYQKFQSYLLPDAPNIQAEHCCE
jgi:hypothetical protein